MKIGGTRISLAGALLVGTLVCTSDAWADDDTLRDLGTNAAPGEIPKWDGTQWRNAHDNVTTVIAGPGMTSGMTNNQATIAVVLMLSSYFQ